MDTNKVTRTSRMEGYLSKKGRGQNVSFIRPWATRYFVVDEEQCELLYYERDNKQKCKGKINLDGVQVFEYQSDDSERPFCFEIRVQEDKGVLILCAKDATRKEAWMKAFAKLSKSDIRPSVLSPETGSQQAHLDFFRALETTPAPDKTMKYGTAGFRDEWSVLPSTFLRMGTLAALRSREQGGRCVGVMITASHNPEQDNGIKIVDTDGGMLSQTWEPHAEVFANCRTAFEFIARYHELAEKVGASDEDKPAHVIIGRDTRPHSLELHERVCTGVRGICGTFFDIGEVTTPQLHFVVQRANLPGRDMEDFQGGWALREYYSTLLGGYTALRESFPPQMQPPVTALTVDAAFGVGGVSLSTFAEMVSAQRGEEYLTVDIRNGSKAGPVNQGCGAEVVQKGRKPPAGVRAGVDGGKLLCSYDGDADRIVFHSFLLEGQWVLFDGDKIAALLSAFLAQEVNAAGLGDAFRMGVVQTAYANGGATAFLRERELEIVFTKTGVKYLHHAALEFDIGVYFEANGHGTVVFSTSFMERVTSYEDSPEDDRKNLAFRRLKGCLDLVNQAVGDALSDMLFTLVALQALNFDVLGWHHTYHDLPSRQTKVPVTNKDLIRCALDEMTVEAPSALQADLQTAMDQAPSGRCFVRPSGTEDFVRVYAEAETQEAADTLAFACIAAIHDHVGVLGELPTAF